MVKRKSASVKKLLSKITGLCKLKSKFKKSRRKKKGTYKRRRKITIDVRRRSNKKSWQVKGSAAAHARMAKLRSMIGKRR